MIEKNMLGKFIRIKRENAGLSQKQFAEQLFVTESAVSKWERGVNYPDLTMITEICRVLDVSERELITASEDTSYRRIKKQALQYERLKKLSFWIPTSAYLLTILICSVCCLTGVMPVSTWLIVLASLACAFLFFPSVTRFVKSKSLIWYLVTSAAGVAALLTVCGAVTKSIYWVPTAVMGVLLGYTVIFLPIVMKKFVKHGFASSHKTLICFAADLLFTAALITCARIITPFDLAAGELLALYGFLPFLLTGFVVSLKMNGLIKGGICTAIFGTAAYFLNYAIGYVLNDPVDMTVNFNDWANCTNGNVLMIILTASGAVGIALFAAGLKKKFDK